MSGLRSAARPGRLRWDDVRLMLAAPAATDGWVSGWTDIDGIRTHHRERAVPVAGPMPVVLVHGLAVSHRYLMPTAHALAGRLPVLVPDLPGFGFSGKPRAVFDVAAHARHLQRWLEHRALGPVCLAGHSFGAEVAARLARTRPDLAGAVTVPGAAHNVATTAGPEVADAIATFLTGR